MARQTARMDGLAARHALRATESTLPPACAYPVRTPRWLVGAIIAANTVLAGRGILQAGTMLVLGAAVALVAICSPALDRWPGLRTPCQEQPRSTPRSPAHTLTGLSGAVRRTGIANAVDPGTGGARRPWTRNRFSDRKRSAWDILLAALRLTTSGEFELLPLRRPAGWARRLAIVLSACGLLRLVALSVGFRVCRHTIEHDRLVLRWSFVHEVRLPLLSMRTVVTEPARPSDG